MTSTTTTIKVSRTTHDILTKSKIKHMAAKSLVNMSNDKFLVHLLRKNKK
tara:strand:- start:563 stop:712 length:150 start_codon:yes stop_codon:yes gene_type:complete